jgi:hypothetical protein
VSATRRKTEWLAPESPRARPPIALAREGQAAVPVAVHDLHRVLEMEFAPEPEVKRWPGAVRLLVLFVGAAAPWAGLIMIARALFD